MSRDSRMDAYLDDDDENLGEQLVLYMTMKANC
jgi:hypothetical protein